MPTEHSNILMMADSESIDSFRAMNQAATMALVGYVAKRYQQELGG